MGTAGLSGSPNLLQADLTTLKQLIAQEKLTQVHSTKPNLENMLRFWKHPKHLLLAISGMMMMISRSDYLICTKHYAKNYTYSLMVLKLLHFGLYGSIVGCNKDWLHYWHSAGMDQGSKQSHTMKNQ